MTLAQRLRRLFQTKRLFGVIAVVWAAADLGCVRNPAQTKEIPLGESFELRAGASAMVEGGLAVTFVGVRSDSRCPIDAVCVWAGDAIVAVRLSQSTGGPVDRELHTAGNGSATSYRVYSITMTALAPHPRSDRQTRAEDYMATFVVAGP